MQEFINKKESDRQKLNRRKKKTPNIRVWVYAGFFMLVLILVIGTNSNEKDYSKYEGATQDVFKPVYKEEEKENITFLEKQKKLYEGTYEFEYVITGAINIKYSGKYENMVTTGYKESSSETLKYKIENGVTYKVLIDKEEEHSGLYMGLNEELFDFKTLFSKLNTKSTIIDRGETSKTYTYENIDGNKIVILLNDKEINKIVIENADLKYEFTFKY